MAKLLGLTTDAMPILHQNKFLVPQISGTHLLALGQRVPTRQTKKKFFGSLRPEDEKAEQGASFVHQILPNWVIPPGAQKL